jgi:methionyl-tRNA formyltransferase
MSEPAGILLVGSKGQALRCVEALLAADRAALAAVATIDDRDDARSEYDRLRAVCDAAGVPLHVVGPGLTIAEAVRSTRPALGVVAGWYRLIPPDVMDAAPRGFVGLHYSALPRYRGGSPVVWAMINGEPEIGISLFSLGAGIDDGDLWAQARVPVPPDAYIGDLLPTIEGTAARLLAGHYADILHGRRAPIAQPLVGATYCAPRKPSDGMIDWRWSARRVFDFVRAQSAPYPGAFTIMDGRRLTIWRARPIDVVFHGTPGQVGRATPEGPYVICGDDRPLLVEQVQLEGEEARPASEVLRSVQIRLGGEGGR